MMEKRTLLEIDQSVLLNLIEQGGLSLNSFRCLDRETKQLVWRSYLKLAKGKATSKTSMSVSSEL